MKFWDSSSEEEEEDISVNVANNAKSESKATEQKPADGEQGNASKEKKSDAGNGKAVVPETESGSSDEDLISDDDDDSEDEEDSSDDEFDESEEEETPPKKAETSEKRPVESAINTPVPNKAEATPQRTDGKKNNVHVNTPYPSKPHDMVTFSEPNQQTQESVGSYFSCKSCHKIFVNEKSLESHSKAKHGGGK